MDEFEDFMLRSNPAPELDPLLLESSAAMARSISTTVDARPVATSRLRGKRRVLTIVAALVMVPSTAVATGLFAARTGQHYAPGSENDNSEVINICAPDFPAYVKSLPQPSDAPPAGMTWHQIAVRVADAQVRSSCHDGVKEVDTFETGIKGDFYFVAGDIHICRALAQHDAGKEKAARQEARLYARSLERINQLGIWGDNGWKADHKAALAGDWDALRYLTQPVTAGGEEPCK